MKRFAYIIVFFIASNTLTAQIDSLLSRVSLQADFRFRVEQDWNSRKSDGSFRDDRSRLRYRVRAGAVYKAKWFETGFRIRTGNPIKQQDPQLTLGAGSKEFGTLPIGIEKAYFEGSWKTFNFWLGKNTFPFRKSNELFWSDNVFPEGVTLGNSFPFSSSLIDQINLTAGHYIIATSNGSFDEDSYFQGFQMETSFLDERWSLFPSFYEFSNIPNIPDGNDTFVLDYSIVHIGGALKILDQKPLRLELDYYRNLRNYKGNDSIPSQLRDQKTGVVAGLKYGNLARKGDWLLTATYAYLEKYSAVDFLAQNDWARWDYSANGSPDGRLTNLNGVELVAGYKIHDKINLIVKYYFVEQLVPLGNSLETGSRIRFDIDVYF